MAHPISFSENCAIPVIRSSSFAAQRLGSAGARLSRDRLQPLVGLCAFALEQMGLDNDAVPARMTSVPNLEEYFHEAIRIEASNFPIRTEDMIKDGATLANTCG